MLRHKVGAGMLSRVSPRKYPAPAARQSPNMLRLNVSRPPSDKRAHSSGSACHISAMSGLGAGCSPRSASRSASSSKSSHAAALMPRSPVSPAAVPSLGVRGDTPEEVQEQITDGMRETILDRLPVMVQIIAAYWRAPNQSFPRREPVRSTKVGRNAPCPCGSGKKFKKCCGSGTPPVVH